LGIQPKKPGHQVRFFYVSFRISGAVVPDQVNRQRSARRTFPTKAGRKHAMHGSGERLTLG
jgi:hypothetical protein